MVPPQLGADPQQIGPQEQQELLEQQQYWPNQPIEHPPMLHEPQFGVLNLGLGANMDKLEQNQVQEPMSTTQRLKEQARPMFADKSEMF